MDKSNFKKLALMGMAGGMLLASEAPIEAHPSTATNAVTTLAAGCGGGGKCQTKRQSQRYYTADADSDVQQQSGKSMTESELMSQLSDEGKAIYRGLSPEGKALALKLASQEGAGAFKDKVQAIKVAAQRMAEKRARMNGAMPSNNPAQGNMYQGY